MVCIYNYITFNLERSCTTLSPHLASSYSIGNCSSRTPKLSRILPSWILLCSMEWLKQQCQCHILKNPLLLFTQSCLTLCDPWTAACQAALSITNSRSMLKLMSIKSVMPSNHLILCCPLLLLPSVFPSIRVFTNESVLHSR